MGFHTGAYATIWSVEDKGNYTKVNLSVSQKNKNTGEYETKFSDFVNFVGAAHTNAKELKPRDRIRIGDMDATNSYSKETNKRYYNFAVFSFESTDNSRGNSDSGAIPASQPTVTDDDPF
nr:MAG TPA: hypothetical protein [Caudoviricetes sp.]